GFGDAAAAFAARPQSGQRRGHTAFVQENQPLRRDRGDLGEILFAPPEVGFTVALGGVERLFLSRRPSRRSRYQTCGMLSRTPASSSSRACTSARIRSGCARNQAFTRSCASAP